MTPECVVCELYLCAGCGRWRPWSDGAADDMPDHCDRCWALAHGYEVLILEPVNVEEREHSHAAIGDPSC